MPSYNETKLREDTENIFREGVSVSHPDSILPEFFKNHPEILDNLK
ncbi:hypothetical protein [Leptospira idonii]|nr:hypothetical protein [Leptospira idonii]